MRLAFTKTILSEKFQKPYAVKDQSHICMYFLPNFYSGMDMFTQNHFHQYYFKTLIASWIVFS